MYSVRHNLFYLEMKKTDELKGVYERERADKQLTTGDLVVLLSHTRVRLSLFQLHSCLKLI